MKTTLKVGRLDHYKRIHVWVVACLLLACLMTGCEEETIRSYQAPKSPPYAPPAPMGPVVGSDSTPTSSNITWDLPDGWQVAPDGSSMAMATFEVTPDTSQGETQGPTRITITELSGQAGGILGNINRWRGQVGLEPVSTIEEQPLAPINIDGNPAGLIDLPSPPEVSAGIGRMLVVLLPRRETNSTWFFKMTGPNAIVSKQKPNFVAFVESVRFEGVADE